MAEPGDAPPDGGQRKAAPKENIYNSEVFLRMENLLEKLKLLDYENSFCVQQQVAPFGRTMFALAAKNPSVQFNQFLDLASWLCTEATGDPSTFQIDKFDDPNTSVNKMMVALRNLNFSLAFPVNKLRLGYGDAVCDVLDFLVDVALKQRDFKWQQPVHDEGGNVEEAEVDEDADLGEVEDEAEVFEEDEAIWQEVAHHPHEEETDLNQKEMIAATIDPLHWKTELERVGPRLKMDIKTLGKEWRAHIEQTKHHEQQIQKIMPSAQQRMQSMSTQIKEAVEKMKSKEQSINNSFESARSEYQVLREDFKSVEEKYNSSLSNVQTLTNSMTEIENQVSEVKREMDGLEGKATDTSPLVDIKRSVQSIRDEVNAFELRIGVVSHTLMQSKLRMAKQKHRNKRLETKQTDEEDFDDDMEEDHIY